ncbi:hypothetical protein FH039_07455 [Thermococcus indicus]|uniref:IFT52 GIFT domain-containing protein n=1 Tax=Thermococcus indicus TaxID=2586643 RepID=A0A4Y5SND6_9EURY|nr:Gldg family protein [Thermococcus indicus]QDA32426.1 hypothetical protein FH039_07455 [Thermococcus indicus]
MKRWSIVLIALLVLSIVPAWAIKPVQAQETIIPIPEIQGYGDSSPYDGQVVTTAGIVTGIAHWTSHGKDRYGFFIQNGTGAWRGIFVYTYNQMPKYNDGTPVSVGDKVAVTGKVLESNGLTEIGYVSSIVKADGIVLETPKPVVLKSGDVAQEQWESVLVEVRDVRVTDPDLGYGEWEVDDGTGPVRVDDLMYGYTPEADQNLAYVIGVVYYSYGNFKIEPRDAEDVVLNLSIHEIQSNTTDEGASIYEDKGVATEGVVTATDSRGFFIQNGTGPWSGIYVYLGTSPKVSRGDYVRIVGTVDEYFGMTEIKTDSENVVILGTADVPAPVVLPTGNVSQEKWEGVLVEVRDVRVTDPDLGHGEWEVDDGSGPVRIDDKLYDYSPGHRSKYVYIRGIVWYSYGSFKIEPRDKKDIEAYRPNPNTISYGLTMYYSVQYDSRLSDLESLYENFTSTVSELVSYGVSFDSDVADKINWVNDSMSEVMEEYSLYEQFKNRADKTGFYLPAMIHLRKALFLGEDVKEEIQFLLPHLQRALEEIKAAQQAQEQENETETGTIPGNETEGVPTNTTQNASQQTPAINITITIPRVLIDASHGQYYVEQTGISYLVDKIENELGWEADIGSEPLTFDLLKDYDVVIILDPKTNFGESEVEALHQYVENGGGLLIAGEWYRYLNTEDLNAIVGDYGITFNADELMDDDHNSGRPYYPFVGIYNKAHPVMKFVPDDWTMYYNGDTLTISGNAVWLIKGYDTSYSVDADGNVVRIKGTNPVIAAAVDIGTGRIVAYGSSKALSDSYNFKYIKSNWPFIKGALLWLAHQE